MPVHASCDLRHPLKKSALQTCLPGESKPSENLLAWKRREVVLELQAVQARWDLWFIPPHHPYMPPLTDHQPSKDQSQPPCNVPPPIMKCATRPCVVHGGWQQRSTLAFVAKSPACWLRRRVFHDSCVGTVRSQRANQGEPWNELGVPIPSSRANSAKFRSPAPINAVELQICHVVHGTVAERED